MEKKITASFIVPIYKGEKYINKIIEMVNRCRIQFVNQQREECIIELIFVNDFPEISLNVQNTISGLNIICLNNDKNVGIHQSRVNGLMKASGEYIVFLDQDDEIMDSFLVSQYRYCGEVDIVVGNAYDEKEGKRKKWFESKRAQEKCKKLYYYTHVGNMIRSPGQCLIKRIAIPEDWKANILKNNGADDLMLWLMLLSNNCKFATNNEIVYIHKFSGENLSLDYSKMRKSECELYEISHNTVLLSTENLEKYLRLSQFRYNFISASNFIQKFFLAMQHLNFIIPILYYKLVCVYLFRD